MGCGCSKVERVHEVVSLKDGFYTIKGEKSQLLSLKGGQCHISSIFVLQYPNLDPLFVGEIHVGQFGRSSDKFNERLDREEGNYNIKFEVKFPKPIPIIEPKCYYGFYSEGKMHISFGKKYIELFQWIDETELKAKFNENSQRRQSMECPYELHPETQGTMIWIQGPPGSGKSTVAQLLARENGFVYYEGDGPMSANRNPFVDPNSEKNPTLEAFEQKYIRDVPVEVLKAQHDHDKEFEKLAKTLNPRKWQKIDWSHLERVTEFVAEDIKFQRSRIGGNFAVANAFPRLSQSDIIRKYNPDCTFICLRMTKELQKERLTKRHPEDKMIVMFLQIYAEKLQQVPKEEDAVFIDVTKDKSPADIKNEIVSILHDKRLI